MKLLLRAAMCLLVAYPLAALVTLAIMDALGSGPFERHSVLQDSIGISAVVVLLATQLVSLALLARTDAVPCSRKVLWSALFFYCSVVAIPIFWFRYAWPSPRERRQAPPP